MDLKKWWDERNNTDKAVIGLTAFCLFSVLYIAVTAFTVPDITFLSLNERNYQIDSNPTQIMVKGQSEPTARVFINSNALNLKEAPVTVSETAASSTPLKFPLR